MGLRVCLRVCVRECLYSQELEQFKCETNPIHNSPSEKQSVDETDEHKFQGESEGLQIVSAADTREGTQPLQQKCFGGDLSTFYCIALLISALICADSQPLRNSNLTCRFGPQISPPFPSVVYVGPLNKQVTKSDKASRAFGASAVADINTDCEGDARVPWSSDDSMLSADVKLAKEGVQPQVPQGKHRWMIDILASQLVVKVLSYTNA